MDARERNRALCNMALEAVEDIIPADLHKSVKDFINTYDEWLVGLEMLIDQISEYDIKLTEEQFSVIREAMDAMGKAGDDRMTWLWEHDVIHP